MSSTVNTDKKKASSPWGLAFRQTGLRVARRLPFVALVVIASWGLLYLDRAKRSASSGFEINPDSISALRIKLFRPGQRISDENWNKIQSDVASIEYRTFKE